MSTYTSIQTGDWNVAATWGGGGYPSQSGGDTAVISAQHTITIPAGHDALATVTMAAGVTGIHTKLVINGSLKLQAQLTLPNFSELNLGAGGILDVNNHNIQQGSASGDKIWLNWQGTSGSHAIVKDTGSGAKGKLTNGTNSNVVADWDYVDYSDLGDSQLGSQTTTGNSAKSIINCTFTNYGDFTILNVADGDALVIQYSDFRNPNGTNKRLLVVSIGGTTPTGARTFSNLTFDGNGVAAYFIFNAKGATTDHIILEDTQLVFFTTANLTADYGFFHTAVHSNYTSIGQSGASAYFNVQNSYVYADGANAHPSSNSVAGGSYQDNVLEGTSNDINFCMENVSINVLRNILIGKGTLWTTTGTNSGALNFKRNTVVTNNAGATSIPMFILTETSGLLTGTVTVRDNLIVDLDTTSNDYGISLVSNTADQIDETDYNNWYGYSGGNVYDHYYNVAITGKTEGDAGFGGHDLNVDPQFRDKTVTLANWDSSLGGPGTAANAIAEMLKLNGYGGTFNNYTIDNLMQYIRFGLTPCNSALKGAGSPYDGSGDIGALPVAAGGVRPLLDGFESNLLKGVMVR